MRRCPSSTRCATIAHTAPCSSTATPILRFSSFADTLGLPIYAKGIEKRNGTGWDIEMNTSPIHINTRPRAVVKGSV